MDPPQGLGSGFDRRGYFVMNVQLKDPPHRPSVRYRSLKVMLKALLNLASIENVVRVDRVTGSFGSRPRSNRTGETLSPCGLHHYQLDGSAERMVVFDNECGTAGS